jgi:hypothetical protein
VPVERFSSSEITRRQLLRGVAGTLLGISVGDVSYNAIKAYKQKSEAKANVVKQGINPPDPKSVANAQKLSEEIRKNPLAERNPDEIWQAKEAEAQQKRYDAAVENRFREIQDKEGPSNLRAGVVSVSTAIGITMFIASGDKRK